MIFLATQIRCFFSLSIIQLIREDELSQSMNDGDRDQSIPRGSNREESNGNQNYLVKHLGSVMGIPWGSCKIIIACGIQTEDDLGKIGNLILDGHIKGLRDEYLKKLLVVEEWKKRNPDKEVVKEFTELKYGEFALMFPYI